MANSTWQSAVYTLWDSTFSVGICLALIVFFRRFFKRQGRLGQFLSRHAFTVYIIHAPSLVFLAIALRNLQLEHLLKFGLADSDDRSVQRRHKGFREPNFPPSCNP